MILFAAEIVKAGPNRPIGKAQRRGHIPKGRREAWLLVPGKRQGEVGLDVVEDAENRGWVGVLFIDGKKFTP